MDEFTEHELENSWWPGHLVKLDSLPVSSRCFLRLTPNKDAITVQVAQHTCTLSLRWRPIFILIDLCQLACLYRIKAVAGIVNQDALKTLHIHSKLLLWYDGLRRYIVVEAEKNKVDLVNDNSWMPPAVHRFCVRVEYGRSHQPKKLLNRSFELQKLYAKSVWSYGELLIIP
jgi:hypothetical protein